MYPSMHAALSLPMLILPAYLSAGVKVDVEQNNVQAESGSWSQRPSRICRLSRSSEASPICFHYRSTYAKVLELIPAEGNERT